MKHLPSAGGNPLSYIRAMFDPFVALGVVSLIVALFYFLGGLWIGSRLAVTGLALAVLTLVGYYLFPAYFLLWMAVVGGGALILAGVWLRTA